LIADDLLRTGDLTAARAALVDAVKRAPGDQGARMFLWQVMAVQGDWDKAVIQLRSLASISGEAQMLATVYNQAISAEKQRAEAYAGRSAFTALVPSSPWVETLAASLNAGAAGRARSRRCRGSRRKVPATCVTSSGFRSS
jgi:protein involved in temperature-dependent protein secretion